MTPAELIKIIVEHYRALPDDYALSLGHWVSDEGNFVSPNEYPGARFSARIKLTLGDLRAMVQQ